MMVVSLNRFENLLCISVLIILNVGKGVGILPQSFYIRLRRGFYSIPNYGLTVYKLGRWKNKT